MHGQVRVPAHKQHGKVHGTHCEYKMEEAIAVWHHVVCFTPVFPCDLQSSIAMTTRPLGITSRPTRLFASSCSNSVSNLLSVLVIHQAVNIESLFLAITAHSMTDDSFVSVLVYIRWDLKGSFVCESSTLVLQFVPSCQHHMCCIVPGFNSRKLPEPFTQFSKWFFLHFHHGG